MRRVEQLVTMKEKVMSSMSPGGFAIVGKDQDALFILEVPGCPGCPHCGTIPLRRPGCDGRVPQARGRHAQDLEDRAKIQKRREAEQPHRRGRKHENPTVAIEKLKDALTCSS